MIFRHKKDVKNEEYDAVRRLVQTVGEAVEYLEKRFGRRPLLDEARTLLARVLRKAEQGEDPLRLVVATMAVFLELDDFQARQIGLLRAELAAAQALCNVPGNRDIN